MASFFKDLFIVSCFISLGVFSFLDFLYLNIININYSYKLKITYYSILSTFWILSRKLNIHDYFSCSSWCFPNTKNTDNAQLNLLIFLESIFNINMALSIHIWVEFIWMTNKVNTNILPFMRYLVVMDTSLSLTFAKLSDIQSNCNI